VRPAVLAGEATTDQKLDLVLKRLAALETVVRDTPIESREVSEVSRRLNKLSKDVEQVRRETAGWNDSTDPQ
jgi:hypothetical protein